MTARENITVIGFRSPKDISEISGIKLIKLGVTYLEAIIESGRHSIKSRSKKICWRRFKGLSSDVGVGGRAH